MTTRKGIFISHIHEEAALGAVMKEWLSDVFRGSGVNVFLSSDKQDLPAGRKWLDVIEKQISEAGVMISLLSQKSLARPWVNIELGAAWIRGVPIIPFCHSDQKVGALPKPFDAFTALTLDDADAAKDLIGGVADALQLQHPTKLPFAEFQNVMRAAVAQNDTSQSVTHSALTDDLPGEQILILATLSASENEGKEEIPAKQLPIACRLTATQFKAHIAQLKKKGLVGDTHWGGDTYWRLLPKGAAWVLENAAHLV